MDSGNEEQFEPKQILKPRNPGEELKVAETVLRKRNRDLKSQAERAQKRLALKRDAKRQRVDLGVVTPEKLIKDGRIKQLDAKRAIRLKNRPQEPHVRYQDRVKSIFVVRNARNPPSRPSLAILRSLGLTRRYSATFVRNSPSELVRLRSVQPFIFYGFLNPEVLHALFMKRLRFKRKQQSIGTPTDSQADNVVAAAIESHSQSESAGEDAEAEEDGGQVQGESFPVTDNVTVEERLSHLGLLCIEDLIEVVKKGSDAVFQQMMPHVAPFQLGDILKAEGVDAKINQSGDLGFKINLKASKLI